MENHISKNSKLAKDLSAPEEITFTTKIFNFFFLVLRKQPNNIFLTCFLISLETLQLISYALESPHHLTWKLNPSVSSYIQVIVGSTRGTPLMKYLDFNYYLILFGIITSYIFIHFLFLTMIIKFNKTASRFYQFGIAFTRYFTTPMTTFLFIPISELILLPLKCDTHNKVFLIKNAIECYKDLHFLYLILGIIFACVFYMLCFVLSVFYFDAFNNKKNAIKISTSGDITLLIFKIIVIIRGLCIRNEHISLSILLLCSLFNVVKRLGKNTYSNFYLNCFVTIRDASVFWTYFTLCISIISQSSKINGLVYLLIIGYPLIIAISIIYYRHKNSNYLVASVSINNLNEYLIKIKGLIRLIDSYLERNKGGKMKNESNKKKEIYLEGIIGVHEETCTNEECPLKKFRESNANFSMQKTSLLHFMNNQFIEGIKTFPESRELLLIYVQFNYEKKYNLNAAKMYLAKLEKSNNSLIENYIIYSLKQGINANRNVVNGNGNDNEDIVKIEETTEQKYQRLKLLVETTTKLYGEFWGIFATNLTNNLNLNKLFFIGNKLNKYLEEINSLWETHLKSKKIDFENQSIAQLYACFLKEIIKNKKRSDEISKKINEEQHFESRKADMKKFDMDNLDIILENQDCVIFCRTNEKGESDIIQCSNSIVYMLGYVKQELIGKGIEMLMPGVISSEHHKMLSTRMKKMRANTNHKGSVSIGDKKQFFILPKTKAGYLLPTNCRFTVYNDDDFSNTYIIKAKFEARDTKSIYAFYVLTKTDFTVDGISSSALNLGLSMDLLKKYMINIQILVRNEINLEDLSLPEKYGDFEEEPRKVSWVFPHKIYPKDEDERRNEEDVAELIKQSETKDFLLLITKIKFYEDDPLGFCFRFMETDTKKGNVDPGDFRPNSGQLILFDMLKMSYVRTVLVTRKLPGTPDYMPRRMSSGNYRKDGNEVIRNKETRKNRKKQETGSYDGNSDDDEQERKIVNILTKEKILELQGRGQEEIRSFIFDMPFYGNDVALEKHRPNKEKYPAGLAQEPIIKIQISAFIKRIEEKMKTGPERKAQKKVNDDANANDDDVHVNASGANVTNDASFSNEFNTDSSASLSAIFNAKSVTYIQIFSFVFFVLLTAIISVEFAISFHSMNDSAKRMSYMDKAYIILENMVYTKFYLTEAILLQDTPVDEGTPQFELKKTQIQELMGYMADCRETISNTYQHYSNLTVSFSKEYYTYTANTVLNLKTLSNGSPANEFISFASAMSRITTSIFYCSTVSDDYVRINMNDRNAYELMMNLLNDYLLVWKRVTFIIAEDVKSNAVSHKSLVIIFVFSFVVALSSLVLFWKLIIRFIDDREKPVDLFLTIKKKKFEELKTVSENFINKLLNKFFGNEENEEESTVDFSANIKEDDINIIKFKSKNDYNQSFRSSGEYLFNYIKLVVFFIVIEAYLTFKFCYNKVAMKNMNQFGKVFNITHYSQADLILSLNVIKSYFYNPEIPIFNVSSNVDELFQSNFITLSDSFRDLLIETYKTNCFLKSKYTKTFHDWLNNDITEIININSDERGNTTLAFLGTEEKGFKSTISRYFEQLRFIVSKFFIDKGGDDGEEGVTNYNGLIQFEEINNIAQVVIRNCYRNLLIAINKEFNDYVNSTKLVNVSTFVVVLAAVICCYCLIWKSYEETLKNLLKTSVDLINLIPEEIKYQIVMKLNEEENKNE